MGTTVENIEGSHESSPSTQKPTKKQKQKSSGEIDAVNINKTHRKRKRQKHHYNAVRAQMEFYFGDANLSKDRFLKQMIDKDPFVPLEVFLTFNKMKALTGAVDEIAKSLSNSQLLELDETQQKVRRKTALPVNRNVDENTLYVEALPPAADHDWVRKTFERFGAVTYVSLPKYAKSRKIKEFGFVEFEQQSSVEKAVKAFKEFNGVLCMQETEPAELKSVKAFIKEQNNEEQDIKEDAEEAKKTKKRQKDIKEEGTDVEEPISKRIKTEDEDANSVTTATEDDDNESTASDSAVEEPETVLGDNTTQPTEVQTKKKRRKHKKSKSIEKRKKNAELNTDLATAYYELKILPKRDWKRLRNKYLNLQREKIAELKRKAWKEQQQAHQQSKAKESGGIVTGDEANSAPTPTKKQKLNERKLHRINMNFYGAGEDESKTINVMPKELKQNPALERAPLFSYEPGLIVEVGFLEPCVNLKEFKADMRQYVTVKYVDVKEGGMHANLRLESASTAEDFVRQVSCAEYKCKVLTGDVETEYWKKIEQDREMKLNKQVKVPQKRGREKVKKLVTKHIRFGDDDEDAGE